MRLPLNPPLYRIIFSLCLNLHRCISPLYPKFPPYSIKYNIVVMDNLQTWPRWTHERESMLPLLAYQTQSSLQHDEKMDYPESTCVLPSDILHMEIHNSLRLIANSLWPLATPSLLIEFGRFSGLRQFYAMWLRCMRKHSCIVASYRWVIYRGSHFHSTFQYSSWPPQSVG